MAKAKTVSKADLVDKVAEDTGMRKKDVKTIVDTMIDQVSQHLNNGDKVQLTGFGTFEVRERRARTGVKPGTTERIEIPASKYPAFKPGKALKEKIEANS
jgi:DNA-binding protein HU-beta